MELKRHLNPKNVFVIFYVLCFCLYVLFGLLPAEATGYTIDSRLLIPSINLFSDVTELNLDGGELNTPDQIVGSFSNHNNKILLIGHSSGVFASLNQVKLGDELLYGDEAYRVISINEMVKADVDMSDILRATNSKTLILMTCSGELYENGDASHRLIINAVLR